MCDDPLRPPDRQHRRGGDDRSDAADLEEACALAGIHGRLHFSLGIKGFAFELRQACDGGQGELGPHRFGCLSLEDESFGGSGALLAGQRAGVVAVAGCENEK